MAAIVGQTRLDSRTFSSLAAALSVATAGQQVVVSAATSSSETLVVPVGVSLWCEARISSSHSGPAIRFNGPDDPSKANEHRIKVAKSGTRWFSGGESTSVGLQIDDTFYQRFYVDEVYGFGTGIKLGGLVNDAGVSYNEFHLGWIADSLVNIHCTKANETAWANQNQFYGGRVVHSSSVTNQAVGSAEIKIDENMNGNQWFGTSMETARAVRSILCAGRNNEWYGCRFEQAAPIEFTSTGQYNMVFIGYGNFGQDDTATIGVDVIDDPFNANQIIGPYGINVQADPALYGKRAGVVVGASLTSEATFRGELLDGVAQFEVVGNTIKLRDAGGTLRTLAVDSSGRLTIGGTVVGTQTA